MSINPYQNQFYPTPAPSYPQAQQFNYQQSPINQFNPFSLLQTLRGRYVGNRAEVEAISVEPDGNITLFPMLDGKEIYGKFIDSSGNARIVKYTLEEQNSSQPDMQAQIGAMGAKIDGIYSMLENMGKVNENEHE